MKKSTVLLAVVLVGSLVTGGTVQPDPAEAYQTEVHPMVAGYASALYMYPELAENWSHFIAGTSHEDDLDHVWDHGGAFDACTTINHFWAADNGWNDPVTSVFCNGANAWNKAEILWGMALGEYHSGDLPSAYEYLGHVAHLLMDMAVPAHAHEEMHPISDSYEDGYLDTGAATLSQAELDLLVGLGPVELPDGPYIRLATLFYRTNQIGGCFASDGNPGDSIDPFGIADFSPVQDVTDCRLDGFDLILGCDFGIIRQHAYFYSIRAVATLYQLFEAAREEPALTVVIEEVQQLECHDDIGDVGCESGPDFFVRLWINGFWFRNEGNQVVNTEHITPGWAFARPVPEETIGVVIQLIDEDEHPNPDDKSDIDPGDGRDLDMTIDMAACIRLEPGAITGDITGACGTTLTSWGEDDDRSQIWFRVIPPNAPPVADAGPDLTVNEADDVTLTGSFTDPNVEDTHTFLWHMESSTNGQTVPNSYDQSVSFTPVDDGVYAFSFTVTDNHGASDTDEVLVTALNVAAVPIIEHLTDETGAEIGVDVPVALAGLPIDLEGTFTDVGTLDTHTASLNWGDGTVETSFDWFVDCTGGIEGFVAADHAYATAGSYSIVLNVTDDGGETGSTSAPIEVVDAAGAVEAVAGMLAPLADDPNIQAALDKLIGNLDGLDFNGALDLLEKGNANAALERIKQALGYIEMAESSNPSLDLRYEKSLLALAAKSVALGEIADAQAIADGQNDLSKITAAQALVASGDGYLTLPDYVAAVNEYQKAVRAV